MRKVVALAFCLIVLWSCRKEDTTNERYPVTQHYYLYYNSFTDSTTFKATFYHRDTKTMLPSGYSITVNDSVMPMLQNPAQPVNPSTGPNYYYERREAGSSGAIFKFRRPDGSVVPNTIPANYVQSITFDSIFTAISRSDTLFILVVTDTLNTDESITVSIYQDDNHFTYETIAWQPGDSVITIFPSQMSTLFTGPADITISRNSPVLPLQLSDGLASGDMRAVVFATQEVSIVQ